MAPGPVVRISLRQGVVVTARSSCRRFAPASTARFLYLDIFYILFFNYVIYVLVSSKTSVEFNIERELMHSIYI